MTDAANQSRDPEVRALLVVPAYNNRATLRDVAERALRVGPDVLAIDDGSTDGSLETLDGLPVATLAFAENCGKGAAILAAAEWAGERGFTHLVTLDADGQHDPAEAPRLLAAIAEQPWAIVVGVRDLSGVEVPRSSRFGRAFSNFWTRLAGGQSAGDSQSGFRAYPVAVLRQLRFCGRRYEFEVEVLVRASWAGIPLAAVDVTARYDADATRVSHFRPGWDNARISWTYARLVARQLLPWPHQRRFAEARNPAEQLSLRRPWHSTKLLLRERLSTREIVLAVMLGILLATLPFIGCHCAVIVFAATRLRLNRLIALNVSHLCAPPFVPMLCLEVGHYVRHGAWLTDLSKQTWLYEMHQRLGEYILGTLIVGPALALLAGLAAYAVVRLVRWRLAARKEAGEVG